MKISKGILKQMIAEEMATFNEKADPGKLPKDRFPMKLSQVDMDTAQAVAQAGDDDGQPEDDVIGVSKGTMPVSQLKPAQSTMKISNAMGMALAMLRGDMKPGGDLGGFISQDGHILDGHHRWVATAMVNPEAEVGGFVVDFPASQIIAVLNTITKGLLGITQGKEGSGSFAQFQEEPMKKQLQDFMENGVPGKFPVAPEKIVAQVKQATGIDDPAQARDALVQRFAKNLAGIKFQVPAGAPERVDMPVIDPGLKKGALQIAVNALTKGLVDVNPPFAGGDQQAAPEGGEEQQAVAESKKDLLKRIVAEEVAKMEIDAVQKEGIFDFFKKKKEEPAPEPEPEAPSEEELAKQKKEEQIKRIEDMISLFGEDYKHIDYFKDRGGSRAQAFSSREGKESMQKGSYGAAAVYEYLSDMDKFDVNRMDLKTVLAMAIHDYSRNASQEEVGNIMNLLKLAAKNQYEYMTRDTGGGSSSSSRKSGFDKWQSGEGDNYNYMTRMESISKKQLAKIVKEELAQLKK